MEGPAGLQGGQCDFHFPQHSSEVCGRPPEDHVPVRSLLQEGVSPFQDGDKGRCHHPAPATSPLLPLSSDLCIFRSFVPCVHSDIAGSGRDHSSRTFAHKTLLSIR